MITISISGNVVSVIHGSVSIKEALANRSTASFTVVDPTGTQHYTQGQPVSISDLTLDLLFTGFVSDSKEQVQYPNTTILSDINCFDNRYLADKRYYSGQEYTNKYAGDIASDLMSSTLAAEGITAKYAVRDDNTAVQFNLGTLINTVGTNNQGDGDLELAPAGTPVLITEQTSADFTASTTLYDLSYQTQQFIIPPTNSSPTTIANIAGLMPTMTPAILLQATCNAPSGSSSYTYIQFWQGSYVIPSSPVFFYDIWVNGNSPTCQMAVDFLCSDGTSFRSTTRIANYPDQQGVGSSPTNDLRGLADGRWYSRQFSLAYVSSYAGKTIISMSIGCEGTSPGTYTCYVRNISMNSGSVYSTSFFNGTLTTNPVQLQLIGYTNAICQAISAYEYKGTRISNPYDISTASILRSAIISWGAYTPPGTSLTLSTSIDGGNTFIPCINNSPLSNLLPGTNLAGTSLILREDFTNGGDPTQPPVLESVTVTITPSYKVTSKPDIIKSFVTQADFTSGGTLNGLITWNASQLFYNSSGGLTLNGFTRNYTNFIGPITFTNGATVNGQTFYCADGIGEGNLRGTYGIQANAPQDIRSRMDFAGKYKDFTCEVDVKIETNIQMGIVYRTSYWSTVNNSGGYSVMISPTQILFGYGSNSSSGGFTILQTISVAFTADQWYRLRVVASGSNHSIYVNGIPYILSFNDSTYTNSGYVAVRNYVTPSSGQVSGYFNNFGITANTGTLSGTWTSNAINLTSAGTYGSSALYWKQSPIIDTTQLIYFQTSIDGGTTWQAIAQNGSPVPNLALGQILTGVSLLIRASLSAGNAASLPMIAGISVQVLSAYSSSGSRVAPGLYLNTVGRAGSSLITWIAQVYNNTTLAIDASPDASAWTQIALITGTPTSIAAVNGSAPVPSITTQPDPFDDPFTSNTSVNYTNTSVTGGSVATPTYDTANSRISLTGGNGGAYLTTLIAAAQDVSILLDMDQSDAGGAILHWNNTGNFYYVALNDDHSASTPNTATIYKVLIGTSFPIATTAISFPRGSYPRFLFQYISGIISLSQDGVQLLSIADASVPPGQCGLYNNGGTSRYYQFRVQQLGDDVTSQYVYTRARFTTTDPAASAQLLNLTTSIHSPDIKNGVLIPVTQFSLLSSANKDPISKGLDDLASASSDLLGTYWWQIDKNRNFYFQPQRGQPSPWILTSKDILAASIDVENTSDLYRNSEWLVGGTDTLPVVETKIGDGTSQSWPLGYPVDSITSIFVGGNSVTFGIKGVDTGRAFYYENASSTIIQDPSAQPVLLGIPILLTYTGQITISVNIRRESAITARASLENSSGIVEVAEDGSKLTKATMLTIADSRLTQYCVSDIRTLNCTTNRPGLQIGQILSAFIPQFGIYDAWFLISDMETTYSRANINGTSDLLRYYKIKATEGPVIGDWTKYIGKG